MHKRFLIVTAAVVALAALGAGPAMATRDRPTSKKGSWDYSGVPAADSVDGPKSSSSLDLGDGGYVLLRGYWDMELEDVEAKYSFKGDDTAGDGSPRVSIQLNGGGDVVYLDPYHCPGSVNSAGWETTDFYQTGSDCAIYVSWQAEPYRGTDAMTDDPATSGVDESAPATSAWDAVVAEHGSDIVWITFVVADQDDPDALLVDRVTFGGSVISKFSAPLM